MRESGQSLFEVVIALAISAVIVIALVSLAASSIRNAAFARNKTLAGRYAQEATEWLRGQRDFDIETFKANARTWCLTGLDWSKPGLCAGGDEIAGTPFLRDLTLSVAIVDSKTIIEADVKVKWTDAQGVHEVRSATNFSDWRER